MPQFEVVVPASSATERMAMDTIERMAKYAVDSGLFGVKTIPQACALMLLCQAKGMHPMEAMEEYHIIQGRHTMKSERMLAKFQQAGGTIAWKELTDQRAEATFSHIKGGTVTIDWDIERARRAGLAGKDNWKSYARSMLRARVVSEGINAILPGVKSGVMTPEEAIDLPPVADQLHGEATVVSQEGIDELNATVRPVPQTVIVPTQLRDEHPVVADLAGGFTYAQVADAIKNAATIEALDLATDAMRSLPDEAMRAELDVEIRARRKALESA